MVIFILNVLLFSTQHKTFLDTQHHNSIVVTHKGPHNMLKLLTTTYNKFIYYNKYNTFLRGGGGVFIKNCRIIFKYLYFSVSPCRSLYMALCMTQKSLKRDVLTQFQFENCFNDVFHTL